MVRYNLNIPIGSYSVNLVNEDDNFDRLLIDGQQRITAISDYINNKIKVYDLYWNDLQAGQKVRFKQSIFPFYECNSTDINYLNNYYNLMNYGGTNHE